MKRKKYLSRESEEIEFWMKPLSLARERWKDSKLQKTVSSTSFLSSPHSIFADEGAATAYALNNKQPSH